VQLGEGLVCVGHDRQIGHLHHRTVRIGVDADDVIGSAEPGGVLDRTADAEREIEVGIDDDSGRADLLVVWDPRTVGDDAGCSDRRADRLRELRQLGEALGRVEAGTPADDAVRLGEVDRAQIGGQHVDHTSVVYLDRCRTVGC
jgi:hypothetical protein